jgi:2-oxoglutarate ferredoxin oxidoreductase subunit beta
MGRHIETHGFPIRICELVAQLDGAAYVTRQSLHDVRHIRMAKKAVQKAFEVQEKRLGLSLVEFLSTCPTNWGMSAIEAMNWVEEHMIPIFPLGDCKDPEALDKSNSNSGG